MAQQADSLDRISPVIIATTPTRKIPVDTRPVILVVGQTRTTRNLTPLMLNLGHYLHTTYLTVIL